MAAKQNFNFNTLGKSFLDLFGTEEVCLVVDRDDIYEYLTDTTNVVKYKKNGNLPNNYINIQTSAENYYSHSGAKNSKPQSKESRALRIPQVVFDNSFDSFLYTFNRMLECDINMIQKVKNDLISKFELYGNTFAIKTPNKSSLECKLSDNVQYKYPSNTEISLGKTRSLAEYLELSFDFDVNKPKGFLLNGSFSFKSSVYAILPECNVTTIQKNLARDLFNSINQSKSNILTIEDGFAVSLKINGVEHIEILKQMAGDICKNRVTELAFGMNKNLLKSVNWSINSQINEGCSGVHIGFGDASSGVHMDFIAPNDDMLSMIKNS